MFDFADEVVNLYKKHTRLSSSHHKVLARKNVETFRILMPYSELSYPPTFREHSPNIVIIYVPRGRVQYWNCIIMSHIRSHLTLPVSVSKLWYQNEANPTSLLKLRRRQLGLWQHRRTGMMHLVIKSTVFSFNICRIGRLPQCCQGLIKCLVFWLAQVLIRISLCIRQPACWNQDCSRLCVSRDTYTKRSTDVRISDLSWRCGAWSCASAPAFKDNLG